MLGMRSIRCTWYLDRTLNPQTLRLIRLFGVQTLAAEKIALGIPRLVVVADHECPSREPQNEGWGLGFRASV